MDQVSNIEACQLSLAYRGLRVLDQVSFDVRPGEVVTLIGPNGAGKTTLLEVLSGLRRADSGQVRRGGRTLRHLSDFSSVFSFMPDEAELPAEVRVATLLHHARRFGRAPAALASSLVGPLGLGPLLSARPGELSRGERRRVALYLALCSQRPVVVLDEPCGAFDPRQLLSVLGVLRERAAAGVALVLSVHQMSDAEKIAGRVLMLRAGQVVAFGTIAELRACAHRPDASLEEVFLTLLTREGAGAAA